MPELRPSKQELIDGIGEVATVYRWSISVDRAPNSVAIPDNFNILCSSAMPPRLEAGENIEIVIRGLKYQVPGIYDESHTLELTFIENVQNHVSLMLAAWQEAMWDENGAIIGTKADYSADITMIRLNNSDQPIWQYQAFGCWFMENDPVGAELSADTSDAVRPTMTLYYDRFTQGALAA